MIGSGRDIRNIIRHYAKDGEDRHTYLMVNEWIFEVDPKSLHVHPVGKKLKSTDDKLEIRKLIVEQNKPGRERYANIRANIPKDERKNYGFCFLIFFIRQNSTKTHYTVFFFSWYLISSVKAESARNFRTFPLILMALDLDEHHVKGKPDFWFDEHSMARGGTWNDQKK
ncbi:hypothetical protein ILYODFUR_021473 [Ilyodon furcidens]|uniref:Uncharacterized protein n=1 Tax=Ilyodon furcidens TaxID=33524 RepID=A0ABV0VFV0_9TELE